MMRKLIGLNIFMLFVLVHPSIGIGQSGIESYRKLLKQVVVPNGTLWNKLKDSELFKQSILWIADADLNQLKTKDDTLAFWINAHNICVMQIVTKYYPIKQLDAIPGFLDLEKCKIINHPYSLLEIESGVLQPSIKKDARIHFALWRGTKGSPTLMEEPYEGKTMDQTLELQTRNMIGNSEFVKIHQKSFQLSVWFDWYKHDFGSTTTDLLNFIRGKMKDKEMSKQVPNILLPNAFFSFNWKIDEALF